MARRLALATALSLLLTTLVTTAVAGAAAPPKRRTVRFTAAFELTKRFQTRLVPAETLVGCTYDDDLLPLDGTTGERDTVRATGSFDYSVQPFGVGPPLVQGPALNPLRRGGLVKATFAIERSADVRRPAPCDDDAPAPDRAAQPVPYPMPCAARATEQPPGRVEIWLARSGGRWAIDLPLPTLCNGATVGDDPLFPSTAPAPIFKLPKYEQLARRRRTVVPIAARGDCSLPGNGSYRLDCAITIDGTLTLTRRR